MHNVRFLSLLFQIQRLKKAPVFAAFICLYFIVGGSTIAAAVVPSTPQGLSAIAVSSSKIDLTWSDTKDEIYYKIERSLSKSGPFTYVGCPRANATSYSCLNLSPSTTYYFRISAYNGGYSPYSLVASATTQVGTPAPPVPSVPPLRPAAPSGLIAKPLSANEVSLEWKDTSNNETGFIIEVSKSSYSGFVEIGRVGNNQQTYTCSGLFSSTRYYFRICAYNDGGKSAYYSANTTTMSGPPADPSNLTATVVSSTQVSLKWKDNSSNETGFRVEYAPSGSNMNAQTVEVRANVYTASISNLKPGQEYDFRVYAVNASGVSGFSNTASAIPMGKPAAPNGLVGTAISANKIHLDWTDLSNDETSFQVEQASNYYGPFTVVAKTGANVISAECSGLLAGKTYYFKVCACNSAGNSNYSSIATVKTLSAPNAPTNMSARATSANEVLLVWKDNSTDEQGFVVEYSTNQNGPFVEAGKSVANGISYTCGSLSADTKYYFRVCAFNNAGNSAYCPAVSAITMSAPPNAPTGLVATALSSSEIELRWQDNSTNESGFRFEVASSENGMYTTAGEVGAGATVKKMTSLSESTKYCYRMYAYNAGGKSEYSGSVSVTTPVSIPKPPSNLTASVVSSTEIALQWKDNASNEDGFVVEYSTSAYGQYTQAGKVTANKANYTCNGLSASTTYYFRVCAYNSSGNSSYSSFMSEKTMAAPLNAPGSLSASVVSHQEISIEWSDLSDNETGFYIERSTGTSGVFNRLTQVSANTTKYSDTGLEADTKYVYRVQATNINGMSDYSNTAYATTLIGKPNTPLGLTANTVSSSEIDVSWTDNSSNEVGFSIEKSIADSNQFSLLANVAQNVTSYRCSGLNASTQYTFRVVAFNSAGNSNASNVAKATTNMMTVAAPSNLRAVVMSYDRIVLYWTDNSNNESKFIVEKSASGVDFNVVEETSANSYTCSVTGLQPSTTYTFRVKAENTDTKVGQYSETISAATADFIVAAPSYLEVSTISDKELDLKWVNNANNASQIIVEYSDDGTAWKKLYSGDSGITAYKDSSVSEYTRRYYRIKASANINGRECVSDPSQVRSGITKLTAPAELSGETKYDEFGKPYVELNWSYQGSKASGFRIFRSKEGSPDKVGPYEKSIITRMWKDEQCEPGNTYIYTVAAYTVDSQVNTTLVGNVETTAEAYVEVIVEDEELGVGEPKEISWLQNVPAMGDIFDIGFKNGYAYVVSDLGLQVIDFNDETNPRIVGSLEMVKARRLAVDPQHDYIYVAVEEEVKIIHEVRSENQISLEKLNAVSAPSDVTDMILKRNTVYYTSLANGLAWFDVSNPVDPGEVVTRPTFGNAMSVDVDGDYAVVADWMAGITMVNLSNPAVAHRYTNHPRPMCNVAVQGSKIFAADSYGGHLSLDASNPSTPILLDSATGGGAIVGCTISGNLIYVNRQSSAYEYNALEVFNCEDWSNVQFVGNLLLPGFTRSRPVLQDGKIFMAIESNGVALVDVVNPRSLSEIVTFRSVYSAADVAKVTGSDSIFVTSGGSLCYYKCEAASAALKHIANINLYRPMSVEAAVINGQEYALVADDKTLRVIDFEQDEPAALGSISIPYYGYGICVVNDNAYVACGMSGLYCASIADVDNLQEQQLRHINTGGFAYDVKHIDNKLIVANGTSGIKVYNILNPTSPQCMTEYNIDTGGFAQAVDSDGRLIWIADGNGGLVTVDMATRETKVTPTYGYATGVRADENYIYVTCSGDYSRESRLEVYSRIDNKLFAIASAADGNLRDVEIVDDLLFAADDMKLIRIMDTTSINGN